MLKIEIDLSTTTQDNLLKTISFLQIFVVDTAPAFVATKEYTAPVERKEVVKLKKKSKFEPAPAKDVAVVMDTLPPPPPALTYKDVIDRASLLVREKKISLIDLNKLLNSHNISNISDLMNHTDKLQTINEALNV